VKNKSLPLCLVEVICLAPNDDDGRYFSCKLQEDPLDFNLEEQVFNFLTVLKVLTGILEDPRKQRSGGLFHYHPPSYPSL